MREILFRGKDTDGEWHRGYYCAINDKAYRIYTGYAETDCGTYYPDFYTVIPETVGQYTGLEDKNGTEIFEGDILNGRSIFHDYTENFVCIFRDGGFWFRGERSGNDYCLDNIENAQLIGNIHDNPELLKGEEE